jgi:hypothetical protein
LNDLPPDLPLAGDAPRLSIPPASDDSLGPQLLLASEPRQMRLCTSLADVHAELPRQTSYREEHPVLHECSRMSPGSAPAPRMGGRGDEQSHSLRCRRSGRTLWVHTHPQPAVANGDIRHDATDAAALLGLHGSLRDDDQLPV